MNFHNSAPKRLIGVLLLLFCGIPDILHAQQYFQQRTDYEISVRLDDRRHYLHASQKLTYTNNSRDTLRYIMFHMWPNGYKDRNTALASQMTELGSTSLFFSKPGQQGFIDSLDFKIGDIPVKFTWDSVYADIGKLHLNTPLLPGEKIVINTPFRVKIPDASFSRLGHNGRQYMITQWYPKPAVYDKSGWHAMPYLQMGEFYSEFGSFKVTITLPDNYVVAATGVLQDASERSWLLAKAAQTRNLVISPDSMTVPPSSTTFKSITYTQDSIHDFAFFADKRYQVLFDTLQLEPGNKTIECWSFFTNRNAKYWMQSLKHIKDAVRFYSDKCGPYPYAAVTAVDGLENAGTDMEYPMITTISSPSNPFMFEDLIIHEIGHNWFHGILGSDERNNPWMDEGINTAVEAWFVESSGKGKGDNDIWSLPGILGHVAGTNDLTFAEGLMLRYRIAAYDNQDQPATLTSDDFTGQNYTAMVYNKTAIAFNYLRNFLGDSLFTLCLHDYYNQWAFKHPGPGDIRKVFEDRCGLKLDWFFDGMIGSNAKTELTPVMNADGTFSVSDKGNVHPPVPYQIYSGDSIVSSGFLTSNAAAKIPDQSTSIVSDHPYMLDIQPYNNRISTSGILKRVPRLHFRMKPTLSEKDRDYMLTFLPLPAWNNYNEFMAGGVITNISLLPKRTEFQLTPLWDFKNSRLTGTFGIDHSFYPQKGFTDKVVISLTGKSFAYLSDITFPNFPEQSYDLLSYSKIDPSITISLRRKKVKSTLRQQISIRNIHVWQEEIVYTPVGTDYIPSKETAHLYFNDLTYKLNNSRTLDPFKLSVQVENAANHTKTSVEFLYTFSYAKHRKGLTTRVFAGAFLDNDEDLRNYNFRMSGWNGGDDYRYDYYYFGRSETEGLWSRQFLIRDGGFIVPTAVGQTDTWLTALNIHADLPIPIPIKLFFDIGTYDGIKEVFPDIANTFMYDGGIAISAGYDIFEIYIPFFYSEDIESNLKANNLELKDTIRFVLNINRLSLQQLRNGLLKGI